MNNKIDHLAIGAATLEQGVDYLMIASDRRHVEFYQRDAAGEWHGAVLDGKQVILIECRGFRAELGLGDVYEDVRWYQQIKPKKTVRF